MCLYDWMILTPRQKNRSLLSHLCSYLERDASTPHPSLWISISIFEALEEKSGTRPESLPLGIVKVVMVRAFE